MKNELLAGCKLFMFDLDGTLYCGSNPIAGATRLIETLTAKGYKIKFVSNNSSHSVDYIQQRLQRMGIPSSCDDIITPLAVAGDFIKRRFGYSSVFILGTKALEASVARWGHCITQSEKDCGVVIIARDTEVSYEKLEQAAACLQHGAACVVCNTDKTHPGENGYLVPETGAFFSLIKTVISPVTYYEIGKPEPFLYHYAMDDLTAQECVMVGDNPDTDILGAHRAGCRTVLLKGPLSANKQQDNQLCAEKLEDIISFV